MANVAGVYTIVCKLPFGADGTGTAYTFTGNDRTASFSASIPDKILETVCTSSDLGGGFAAFGKETSELVEELYLLPHPFRLCRVGRADDDEVA